jgi:Kef-type K+ transport system membrane component KefB
MHSLLKPLLQALRRMNDRELALSIILGFLLFFAGILDLLGWWRIM